MGMFWKRLRLKGTSHFVTSCCTDNATNVLGATEKLLTDKNFSAFSIHPGRAIHQTQLFAKDLIEGMEGILKRYNAFSINVIDTIETELPIDDTPAYDIIKRLEELSFYLFIFITMVRRELYF